VFVARTKLIVIASAVALAMSVVAPAGSSLGQAPAEHRSGHRHPSHRHPSHARLSVLDRPSDHFKRSLELARRKAIRAQEARAQEAGVTEAQGPSSGYPTPDSVGVSSATLDAIASCESGGDPTAVSADGTYRGKYQFDYGTWASVGGSGDPAAAPAAEQDYRAALLYGRGGSSPWPICG
jgi:soluble lytic murein transglycosylase-like protein